jgi:hypothetical protein
MLSDDRNQVFATWHNLTEKKKENLYKTIRRRNSLAILQGLGEILSHQIPSREEKNHMLLAYKSLDWLWFKAIPEPDDQPFTIYIRYDRPEDQGPGDVNDTFDMSPEELQRDCKDIEKPEWAKKKNTKRVRVTIQSFPYKVE